MLSDLHLSGELNERADLLRQSMSKCTLCPRNCKVDRISGEKGFCGASSDLIVSSCFAHFGEEAGLVGQNGSGTIFFSHCNLKCIFCQNWELSFEGEGEIISIEQLAGMMLNLQDLGCHNINLVSPSHYIGHIVKAINLAVSKGLGLPIVYNTCGWEKQEVLKLLDGIVDIYLADYKYANDHLARAYSSSAADYNHITQNALLEMNRQVGVAKPNEQGIIERGLMIRHLVLPNNISSTKSILQWIADYLPVDTYVNIMAQYRPAYAAFKHKYLNRRLFKSEYQEAVNMAKQLGLSNIEIHGII